MSDKRYPTRMHEVLGVETGERFKIHCFDSDYFLTADGIMCEEYKSGKIYPASGVCWESAINRGITRRPRLTEEQEYVLKALYVAFDFKWVAKKEDGQVRAFEDKPQKHKYFSGETRWYCGEGEEEKDYGWKVKPSSPICGLVSWSDPEPLDIVATLKANGVEVEG